MHRLLSTLIAVSALLLSDSSFAQKHSKKSGPTSAERSRGSAASGGNFERRLQASLKREGVELPDAGPAHAAEKVRLGQLLFFDRILGGNQDVSCATCHHPLLGMGDNLSLSIGVGGSGLGQDRDFGTARSFIPRNAPEIFNRGSRLWTSQFWDSRAEVVDGEFLNPAGDHLPDGLDSILAVQAMFPVTSRDELRGHLGENELGAVDDDDFQGIWDGLMNRLLAIPEYEVLFQEAYPEKSVEELGFEDAANAIAAFESEAFTFFDSPFDRYLAGDSEALDDQAKRGALVFFGKGKCSQCHSGPLLTDQQHHNMGTPQLGPGKEGEAPEDFGRFRVTGDPKDLYHFRTPPLRNVEFTGPYMHDGAFTSLEGAVRHHLETIDSFENYDESQLDPRLQDQVLSDSEISSTLDPFQKGRTPLKEDEIEDLLAFLRSLTSESVFEASVFGTGPLAETIPAAVPSGLPVDRVPD